MAEKTTPAPQSKSWLTRGVLGIGLASLFSDWGHEAATAILPAFLASLGAPAKPCKGCPGKLRRGEKSFDSAPSLSGGCARWQDRHCRLGQLGLKQVLERVVAPAQWQHSQMSRV